MPVLNEAVEIDPALAALAPLRHRGAEVIVVDGGSVDDTAERATAACDRVLQSAPGRARQMQVGAAAATGDWLLFLHVDTRLPMDAPAWLESLPERGWGFFPVRLSGAGPMLRVVERAMSLRSAWTRIATGDQALHLAREDFAAVGGIPALPLMEDIALSARLRRRCPPRIWRSAVVTSSRRWEHHGVMRTIVLMWWLRLAFRLGVSPARLQRWYQGSGSVPSHD